MGSTPKPPKESAAQKAFDIEQRRALNDEVIEENRRRKALARGRLGAVTLLSGLPSQQGGLSGGAPSSSVGSGGVLDGGSGFTTNTSATSAVGGGRGSSGR